MEFTRPAHHLCRRHVCRRDARDFGAYGFGELPYERPWIFIDMPSEVSLEQLIPDDLSGWDLKNSPEARQFGDEWHRKRRSLILVVPSIVTCGIGRNVLINQDHPEFRSLKASHPRDVRWDARLFHSTR
jgi:RES domain-containing protein